MASAAGRASNRVLVKIKRKGGNATPGSDEQSTSSNSSSTAASTATVFQSIVPESIDGIKKGKGGKQRLQDVTRLEKEMKSYFDLPAEPADLHQSALVIIGECGELKNTPQWSGHLTERSEVFGRIASNLLKKAVEVTAVEDISPSFFFLFAFMAGCLTDMDDVDADGDNEEGEKEKLRADIGSDDRYLFKAKGGADVRLFIGDFLRVAYEGARRWSPLSASSAHIGMLGQAFATVLGRSYFLRRQITRITLKLDTEEAEYTKMIKGYGIANAEKKRRSHTNSSRDTSRSRSRSRGGKDEKEESDANEASSHESTGVIFSMVEPPVEDLDGTISDDILLFISDLSARTALFVSVSYYPHALLTTFDDTALTVLHIDHGWTTVVRCRGIGDCDQLFGLLSDALYQANVALRSQSLNEFKLWEPMPDYVLKSLRGDGPQKVYPGMCQQFTFWQADAQPKLGSGSMLVGEDYPYSIQSSPVAKALGLAGRTLILTNRVYGKYGSTVRMFARLKAGCNVEYVAPKELTRQFIQRLGFQSPSENASIEKQSDNDA